MKNNKSQLRDDMMMTACSPRKSPDIGMVGCQIYDSKTCHQCRQKNKKVTVPCKNYKKGKPCTLIICQSCLKNGYNENAKDMVVRKGWSCPKCRGICHCSVCRKKNGREPTGKMIHTAKELGYTSVHEFLTNKRDREKEDTADDLVNNKNTDIGSMALADLPFKKRLKRNHNGEVIFVRVSDD